MAAADGPAAFEARNADMTQRMAADPHVREVTREWVRAVLPYEYHYHFTWLGVPIIQFPSDLIAMQELLWAVKPDLIVETGIARGGSLGFYASMLELLGTDGHVVGIDVDIRPHTRLALERHPFQRRISMIEGSSLDPATVALVKSQVAERKRTLVVLDSNHTHHHVAAELDLYSPFVSSGSYLVVFDTVIEQLEDRFHEGRPWKRGNSPYTAVHEFLNTHAEFEIDPAYERKVLVTVSPDGFLRRR